MRTLSLLSLLALAAGGVWALTASQPRTVTAPAPAAEPRRAPEPKPGPRAAPRRAPAPPTASTRLFVGGGSFPDSTEVSLEQDAALARQVMGPDIRVLFAGGSDVPAVRVLAPPVDDRDAALRVRLGEVFAPRIGRDSRYRLPGVEGATRARLDDVEAVLRQALAQRGEPLWIHVAAHGEQGETPRDNRVGLWAGEFLHVDELARLHEAAPRPLRVVVASCYSGGFAELAFAGADEASGPAPVPRCGLFAGTWDRQTSGCDPDPDRRRQEGYSLHFLHAIDGRDREGRPLPAVDLDLDSDGARSLLEAHTRVRTHSRSIDVPTTTSERLLRSLQKESAPPSRALLPEEWAVLSTLGQRLSLADADAARRRWEVLDRRLTELDDRVRDAEQRSHQAYLALAEVLLSRWPVLDDPYHPDFTSTFEREREAIAAVLAESEHAAAYSSAHAALDAADDAFWVTRVDEAMLSRYLRAHETLSLASALRARGGPDWEAYARMLACERWVPGRASAPSGPAERSADGLE